jgi:hypothetical protein
VQTKFRSDLILGLATRGPKTENAKSAVTPELIMAGSSPNFYRTIGTSTAVRIHDIIPGFLIDLLFNVTEVKVCLGPLTTAGAIDLKLWTYVHLGHLTSQTKFRSDLILG